MCPHYPRPMKSPQLTVEVTMRGDSRLLPQKRKPKRLAAKLGSSGVLPQIAPAANARRSSSASPGGLCVDHAIHVKKRSS